jgi:hypothetical protein
MPQNEGEQVCVSKKRCIAANEPAGDGGSIADAIAERSRCPALPFELIQEIVRLVSRRDMGTTTVSTARLRELASISKSWNAAARPELFRTFTFGSEDAGELNSKLPSQLERWKFLMTRPDLARLVRTVDVAASIFKPVEDTCALLAETFPHATGLRLGVMINKTYDGDADSLELDFPALQMLTLRHYAFLRNRVPAAADFARMALRTVSLSGGRATLADILEALGAAPSALTIQALSLECNDLDARNPDTRPLMLSPFRSLHTIDFEMSNNAGTSTIYPTMYLHTGESYWDDWPRGTPIVFSRHAVGQRLCWSTIRICTPSASAHHPHLHTIRICTPSASAHHPHLHTMRMRLFGVTDLTMELLRRTYARGDLPALRVLEWRIQRAGAVSALDPTWIQFHGVGSHNFEPFAKRAEGVQPRILPEALEAGLDTLRIDVACGMAPDDTAHVESLFGVAGRPNVLTLRNGACTNAEPGAVCANILSRHQALNNLP